MTVLIECIPKVYTTSVCPMKMEQTLNIGGLLKDWTKTHNAMLLNEESAKYAKLRVLSLDVN